MTRRQTLLDGIEQDALDGSASLAGALRKCIALGGRAGSTELRDWATREARGYEPAADDLPGYRRIPASLKVDTSNMRWQAKGQLLSPSLLPDFAREHVKEQMTLYQGVGELEAMHRQALERGGHLLFGFAMSTDLAAYMTSTQNNGTSVDRIYHEVSAVSIAGVLDAIRTSLTELVAELRDGPTDSEGVPSADAASQAVNVVVHGIKNRVRVVSPQTTGGEAAAEKDPWWKRWQVVSALVAGAAGLTTAGIALSRAISG